MSHQRTSLSSTPETTPTKSLSGVGIGALFVALAALAVGLWFVLGGNLSPTGIATGGSADAERQILLPTDDSVFTVARDSITLLPSNRNPMGNGVQHLYRADGVDQPTLTVSRTQGVRFSHIVAPEGSDLLVRGLPTTVWQTKGDSLEQIAWIESRSDDGTGDRVSGMPSTSLSSDELLALANELSADWTSPPEIPGFVYAGTSPSNGLILSFADASTPGAAVEVNGPGSASFTVVTFEGDLETELGVLVVGTRSAERTTLRDGKRAAISRRAGEAFDEGTIILWEEQPGLVGVLYDTNLRPDVNGSQVDKMLEFVDELELVTIGQD